MKIISSHFGELEIDENRLLHFAKGVPGFESETEYALLAPEDQKPFAFLQAANNAGLMFVVVDPFQFVPQYEFDLPPAAVEELGLAESNVMIRSIVSIPGDLEKATINLAAPIVVNTESRAARQVVLGSMAYSTRHPLFAAALQR